MTTYLSAAETAKLVRKALKVAFPVIKFSVKTRSTGSINIGWTDGPTVKRVEEITAGFAGKGFDGMIDMGYSIQAWVLDGEIVGTRCAGTLGSMGMVSPWGLVAPREGAELVSFGASFIFHDRDISPAFANRLIKQIVEYWGGVEVVPVAIDGYSGYKLEPAIERQAIRPDLANNGCEAHYSWSSCIGQAASDATRFAQRG